MSKSRITEEVVIRGVIDTLRAHHHDLTPDEISEFRGLLMPYQDDNNLNAYSLESAIAFLGGDDPDSESAIGCLTLYLFHNDLVPAEQALVFETHWRDVLNEALRQRGDVIDPDGPPFTLPDDYQRGEGR